MRAIYNSRFGCVKFVNLEGVFWVHNTYGFSSLVVDTRYIYIYDMFCCLYFLHTLKLLRDVEPKHGGLKDVFAFQKGDVQVPCYFFVYDSCMLPQCSYI